MATAFAEARTASLKDRLAALHAERVRTWEPAALQRNIDQRAELVAAADPARLPQAGDRIDDAPLVDVESGPVDLYTLTALAPTALVFFRFATCPACNIALPHYDQALWPTLRDRGIQLIGVSPQRPDRLIEIKQRHGLGFRLATDPDNGLARQLGIAFIADAATRARHRPGDPWIGETTGTGTWELPQPAVLLIDRQNIVRFIDVSPDWLDRTEAQTIIDASDSIAFK